MAWVSTAAVVVGIDGLGGQLMGKWATPSKPKPTTCQGCGAPLPPRHPLAQAQVSKCEYCGREA